MIASSIAMRVLTQEFRWICGARGVLRGEGYDITREEGSPGHGVTREGKGKGW